MFLLMGQFATPGRPFAIAVQRCERGDRAFARRRRDGGGRRLRRLRRHLRQLARDRRDDGPGRLARAAPATTIEPRSRPRTLAAGGTLGILIPPSIVLVVYAILAEQNIAKLFMAAFVPGIIAALGYMIAIGVYVRVKPGTGPAGERHTWRASESRRCAKCGRCCAVRGGLRRHLRRHLHADRRRGGRHRRRAVLRRSRYARACAGTGCCESLLGTAEATRHDLHDLARRRLLNVVARAHRRCPRELAQWVGRSGLPPLLVLVAIIGILRRAGLPDGRACR